MKARRCSLRVEGGPMGRLPVELLGQVFEHCLSQEPFPVPSSSQAPLLLAHTCFRWRAAAFSVPSLWSNLHLTYKDPALDIPMTHDWLQRSGCLPLSISLSIHFNEQPAQDLLDLICRHSSRWKHIRFEFRGLYCPPIYSLALAEKNTPLLRAFEFDARDISSANVTPIISLLESSPNLRELTWVDDLADTHRLMELPLSRLTLLSIAMSHGTLDYLQLLDQCFNLEHIRITRPRPGDTRLPRDPLVLSKLTTLNIAYDLTPILDSLVLPALRHVRIHHENQSGRRGTRRSLTGLSPPTESGGPTWSPVGFLSLIQRSSCTIQSLSIDAPISESCLVQCLEITSESLTSLTIAGSLVVTDKLLSCLTCSSSPSTSTSSQTLCPSLHEISLNTHISSKPGSLLQMTLSRLKSTSIIGGFTLRIWDGHKDIPSLRSTIPFRNQFKLEVMTPPKDVFSSVTGFPISLGRGRMSRRYPSGKRLTCQSR